MAQAPKVYQANQPQQHAPRRPRKYPYRDAIYQSAQHYDLYEMIRHPHLAKGYRPPDPPPRPLYHWQKPPTKQELLEKEIEERFLKNEQRFLAEKFGFLLTLLKFTFKLFVLPPYMLLYQFPKWIFTVAIPFADKKITDGCKSIILRIKKGGSNAVHKVVDPFKRLWKQMKDREKNPSQVEIVDEEMGFFTFIAQGFIFLYTALIRPIFRTLRAIFRALIKTYHILRKVPGQIRAYTEHKRAKMKERARKIKAYFKKQFILLLKKLKQRIVDSIKRSICNKIEKVKLQIKKTINQFVNSIEMVTYSIKEAILHPFQSIRSIWRTFTHKINQSIQNKVFKIKNALLQKYQMGILGIKFTQKVLSAVFIRPLKFAHRCYQLVFGKIQFKQVLNRFKNYCFILKPQLRIVSFDPYKLFLKRIYANGENFLKIASVAIFAKSRKLVKTFYKKFLKMVFPVVEIIHLLSQPFAWAAGWIILQFKGAFKILSIAFQPIRRFVKHLIMRCRIVLAWVKVLYRYSMRQMIT